MAEKKETTTGIEELVAGLQEKIARLEAEVQASRLDRLKITPVEPGVVVRKDHPAEGGGWLVRTANEGYEGATFGIKFSGGLAVVDWDTENGDWIVNQLENDFGYEVRAISAEQVAEVRKLMALAAGKSRAKGVAEKMAGNLRL